jgi:hypothetical protein
MDAGSLHDKEDRPGARTTTMEGNEMKSRWKKIAVAVGAVLMLCAFASASASAATSQWYVAGKALSGSAALSSTTKTVENVEIGYWFGEEEPRHEAQISCSTASVLSSSILAPGQLKLGNVQLSGCAVTYPTGGKCSVEGGRLGFNPLKAELAKETAGDGGVLAPETGKKWDGFGFHGCVLEGPEFQISGTYAFKLPHGQTESVEQEVVFEKASGLTSFGSNVYITGKLKLKLASGTTWSMH